MLSTEPKLSASEIAGRLRSISKKLQTMGKSLESGEARVIASELSYLSSLPIRDFVPGERKKLIAENADLRWLLDRAIKGKVPFVTARIISELREENERLKKELNRETAL